MISETGTDSFEIVLECSGNRSTENCLIGILRRAMHPGTTFCRSPAKLSIRMRLFLLLPFLPLNILLYAIRYRSKTEYNLLPERNDVSSVIAEVSSNDPGPSDGFAEIVFSGRDRRRDIRANLIPQRNHDARYFPGEGEILLLRDRERGHRKLRSLRSYFQSG